MSKEIFINYLNKDKRIYNIVPLDLKRSWMDATLDKYAYKCVPLKIANKYGWMVTSPFNFSVSWFGGEDPVNVEVYSDDPDFVGGSVVSHFGGSTFTLELDFIVQTPENYSLYLRGIPNKTYGILKPLDAIVETDWLPFPFAYSFVFIEPGIVEFKKGEPLFSFFPIERNSVENFKIRARDIDKDSEFFNDFQEYYKSRIESAAGPNWHEKFYLKGEGPNKKFNIKNHITKLFFGTIDK